MDNDLRKILIAANEKRRAVGHFNISNLEQLRAIVLAASEFSSQLGIEAQNPIPIMIGVSEGERNFIGLKQCFYLIKSFREEFGMPIFLNADHSRSVQAAKAAFDAGFDSVHIDLSKLSYEENIKGTKEVVDYVKTKNPDVSVEGELGYLRGESKIQKEIIEIQPDDLTKPGEAEEFVKITGVDRFAGAFGNIHGIAANEPKLDIKRIAEIRNKIPEEVAIVLHGGSGIPDTQIKEAVKSGGVNNIHVNTEIRAAYARALKKSLEDDPDQIVPYKIFPPVIEEVKQKVKEKLKLFDNY